MPSTSASTAGAGWAYTRETAGRDTETSLPASAVAVWAAFASTLPDLMPAVPSAPSASSASAATVTLALPESSPSTSA